jgi:hypothetical protein
VNRARSLLTRPPLAAALVAATALLVRVPTLFSQPATTFDEGVYGASVFAMRHGGRPFHDVFSSQGPLYLPLLRLADLVGFEAHWAPRLAGVGAGVFVALGCYFLVSRYTNRVKAFSIGIIVALSGSVLRATAPIQSEGPAIAFGLAAVMLAITDEGERPWRPWIAGAFAGAAVAIKSVFVFPLLAGAVAVYFRRRRYGAILAAATGGAIVLVASILPWGWNAVYEQSIAFQRAVPRATSVVHNLANTILAFGRYDIVLLVAAAAATISWIARRPAAAGGPQAAPALMVPTLVWLAGSLVLLIGFLGPGVGFRRYLAILVIPVALLVGASRISTSVLLALALLAIPVQLVTQRDIHPPPVSESELAALAFIEGLPQGTTLVTDFPGIAWWAERRLPPDLNDTSDARFEAGSLTESEILDALRSPEVCAYVPWSHRFATWFDIDPARYDFVLAADLGEGRLLYLRRGCGTA